MKWRRVTIGLDPIGTKECGRISAAVMLAGTLALAAQGVAIKEIVRRTHKLLGLVAQVLRGARTDMCRSWMSSLDPFLTQRHGAEIMTSQRLQTARIQLAAVKAAIAHRFEAIGILLVAGIDPKEVGNSRDNLERLRQTLRDRIRELRGEEPTSAVQ